MLHVGRSGVTLGGHQHTSVVSRLTGWHQTGWHHHRRRCPPPCSASTGALLRVYLVSDVHTDYSANAAWVKGLKQRVSPNQGYG